jgi:acyl-ACP thioesterase
MPTTVRLSDTTPEGAWRLDGIARVLQDVATEDYESTDIVSEVAWVARRTALRSTGTWPRLYDELRALTWCSGFGAAWVERRTNIYRGDELVIETATLWVPVDPRGFPMRLSAEFLSVYGEAIGGRKVSGRVPSTSPPAHASRRPWPLRRADLDVIGHVNNAAVWQALAEMTTTPVRAAEVIHHGAIEFDHDVELVADDGELWLLVDGEVRVAAVTIA